MARLQHPRSNHEDLVSCGIAPPRLPHQHFPAKRVAEVPRYQKAVQIRTKLRDFSSPCDILSHMTDPVVHSLKAPDAKARVRSIVENGVVEFSRHAREEMEKDNLDAVDCENVLRGGVYDPDGFQRGEWRYRAQTNQMCVVFTFLSETRLRVITAWRERR